MNAFYNEIADHFYGVDRETVFNAIEFACIAQSEWELDPEYCMNRVQGALEEIVNFDFEDYGPTEYQEWYDFDPDC